MLCVKCKTRIQEKKDVHKKICARLISINHIKKWSESMKNYAGVKKCGKISTASKSLMRFCSSLRCEVIQKIITKKQEASYL